MKQSAGLYLRRWLSAILALGMALSLAVSGTWTAKAEDTYTVDLSGIETAAQPGDTISLTAVVTKNGETVTDLDAEGLQFTFWADCWNDHTDGNSDASISNEHSVTDAAAALPSEGTYYIVGELYDSSWNKLASQCVTVTVAESASEEGYRIDLSAIATSAAPGDTISLTASVYSDGQQITDLDAAGLQFTFWADCWNDHTDGNSDASISDEHSVTGAAATLPSEGTYYIVGELYDSSWSKLASACVTVTVAAAQEGYAVTVTADPSEGYSAGDTVSLTAIVTLDGKEITDLSAAGLQLWWWTDVWAEGHTDGQTDASYSNYDNNSGSSLTADVTLPSVGSYYIAAELQDASGSRQAITYTALTAEQNTYVTGELNVEKISGLSSDFIMGLDISSVVSEYESGVTFKDYEGNELTTISQFCQFLKSCGITHIRVRVWNDPYDSDGNGYGGGNNDISAAVKIAQACADAGLKLLVDFHCSDFWTDPSKQFVPKAWSGYSLSEKESALYDFISDSLNQIAATGADVDMVQVGNETTSGFVGETSVANMCALFQSGAEAVRDFDEDTRVVIHVTNPEKSNLTKWAKNLSDNSVDYDILATSYYPYWHGTLANLESEMTAVQETYGKDVMVAETSYAYTLEDTDGHDNTVREGNNDSSTSYAFTPQGQANFLRDLMAAVSEAGGLGVYYWEPAWITVGDTSDLTGDAYDAQVEANKALWEEYGSGWASSYAAEYDPDDAGKWYGGSAVDNQALFYPDGTPVASLHVWDYVKTGAISNKVSVDSIEAPSASIAAGGSYTLPETITVTYSSGDAAETVVWDESDLADVNVNQVGTYVIHGTVTPSKEITDGDYAGAETLETTFTLTVQEANLITDPDDAGLEKSDNFTVDGSGVKTIPSKEDVLDGNGGLHWYSAAATVSTVTYDKVFDLDAGWYTFEAVAMGYAGDTVTLKILNSDGAVLFSGTPAALAGWTTALSSCETPSVTFHLEEAAEIQLQIELGISDGGWGSLDCLYLHEHASPVYTDNGDGTHSVACDDCGAALATESCELTLIDARSAAVNGEEGEDSACLIYECVCGAQETVPFSAEITGLPDSVELYLGKSTDLVASFVTTNLPEGLTCTGTYQSSTPEIVQVSEIGRLTPTAVGTGEILYTVSTVVSLPGGNKTIILAQKAIPVTVLEATPENPDMPDEPDTPDNQDPVYCKISAKSILNGSLSTAGPDVELGGQGTYRQGDTVSLVAGGLTGYLFEGWYDADGVLLTTDDTYCFVASGDACYYASYLPITDPGDSGEPDADSGSSDSSDSGSSADTSTGKKTGGAATGDSTNPLPYVLLLTLCGIGAVSLSLYQRKKHHNSKR